MTLSDMAKALRGDETALRRFPPEYAAILLRTRDRLQAVGAELAPQLSQIEDRAEAERLISIALEQAMIELMPTDVAEANCGRECLQRRRVGRNEHRVLGEG